MVLVQTAFLSRGAHLGVHKYVEVVGTTLVLQLVPVAGLVLVRGILQHETLALTPVVLALVHDMVRPSNLVEEPNLAPIQSLD